jgi:hypothetical protein
VDRIAPESVAARCMPELPWRRGWMEGHGRAASEHGVSMASAASSQQISGAV